jgi:hypothetical protein
MGAKISAVVFGTQKSQETRHARRVALDSTNHLGIVLIIFS